MVPRARDLEPAGRHRAAGGIQVVPGAAILEPGGRHITGSVQVVPGRTHLRPARRHRATGGIQVVPGATDEGPAARLSTRVSVVVPRAAILHPARAHVSGRIESVDRATNRHRLLLRVRAVRVAVPPAARILLPLTGLWLGLGLGSRGGSDTQHRRVERVRGIAHVDAQAHIPAGRRPRV